MRGPPLYFTHCHNPAPGIKMDKNGSGRRFYYSEEQVHNCCLLAGAGMAHRIGLVFLQALPDREKYNS